MPFFSFVKHFGLPLCFKCAANKAALLCLHLFGANSIASRFLSGFTYFTSTATTATYTINSLETVCETTMSLNGKIYNLVML